MERAIITYAGRRAGLIKIVKITVLSLCASLLLISCHSKTYNEYMSCIKAHEAAINKAISLFDMPLGPILPDGKESLEYLTDGDEKRDVVMALDRVCDLFQMKCQQLAVGKYKLTSKNGHTYIIELTNRVIRYGEYSTYYLARIYNDGLLGVGEWSSKGVSIYIVFEQETTSRRDNIEINIWLNRNFQTLMWCGVLERSGKYFADDTDEGAVEKIE